MVSTDNEDRKRKRALELAGRYPASREILSFYVGLVGHDSDWATLRARLREIAPAAANLDDDEPVEGSLPWRILHRHSPQMYESGEPNLCPVCGSAAQCGVLRAEGEGRALFLVCSLCTHEWTFSRVQCPACLMLDEKQLSFYSAEQFPHIQTLICEQCLVYLHVIDCTADLHAVPEVDELACTPLDIWAREQGYRKVTANLAGV